MERGLRRVECRDGRVGGNQGRGGRRGGRRGDGTRDAGGSARERPRAARNAIGILQADERQETVHRLLHHELLVRGGARRLSRFDRNADYTNSRVQLYIDPVTRAWEVKYNCTTVLNPLNTPPFSTICDSAAVYNPATDTQTFPPDAEGFSRIEMKFRNNACKYVGNSNCPAIDATVRFKANPSAPGGYEIRWDRDGFPSMGVYVRNAADTDWLIAEEDPQKTKSGINAILALAGEIRAKGYNYPPPGNQPEGCFRQ